jgi:hypothetical protein
MDRAASKTRTIERKLRKVEALPTSETTDFLEGAGLELDPDDDNPPETELEKAGGAEEMPRDVDRA